VTYERAISWLSRFDRSTFDQFLGGEFIESLSEIIQVNRNRMLAELLIHKYGPTNLFDNTNIRLAVLDLLSDQDRQRLREEIGTNNEIEYFRRYNISKSDKLIRFLDFPDEFKKINLQGNRSNIEKIEKKTPGPYKEKSPQNLYSISYEKMSSDKLFEVTSSKNIRIIKLNTNNKAKKKASEDPNIKIFLENFFDSYTSAYMNLPNDSATLDNFNSYLALALNRDFD
tara:strand:- start:323 stop:1003 length:681 start_codon:yes stop_codon:yes gene_type:complete